MESIMSPIQPSIALASITYLGVIKDPIGLGMI